MYANTVRLYSWTSPRRECREQLQLSRYIAQLCRYMFKTAYIAAIFYKSPSILYSWADYFTISQIYCTIRQIYFTMNRYIVLLGRYIMCMDPFALLRCTDIYMWFLTIPVNFQRDRWGVYILVRKRYLFPPTLLKVIFFPLLRHIVFQLPLWSFALHLAYFAFILPFYFPFSHFLSPFFLFLSSFFLLHLHFPLFSLRLFIFFPPNDIGRYF